MRTLVSASYLLLSSKPARASPYLLQRKALLYFSHCTPNFALDHGYLPFSTNLTIPRPLLTTLVIFLRSLCRRYRRRVSSASFRFLRLLNCLSCSRLLRFLRSLYLILASVVASVVAREECEVHRKHGTSAKTLHEQAASRNSALSKATRCLVPSN